MSKRIVISPANFIIVSVFLLFSFLLPAGVQAGEDWPDLEKIDCDIPGLGIPVFEEPRYSKDDYLRQVVSDYGDGTSKSMTLLLNYYSDDYVREGGGINSRMKQMAQSSYSKVSDVKLDSYRERDGFHEIQVETGRPDRYSVIYRLDDTTNPWQGARYAALGANYVLKIEGSGAGWGSDAAFVQAFDTIEQYIRDIIQGLEGGLSLNHYAPFDYLKAGGGYDHRPAGDIVATLTNEDGKPVKNRTVIFYLEPGTSLEQVMNGGQASGAANAIGLDKKIIGESVTDKNGKATINYIWPNLIDTAAFFGVMQQQRALYEEDGKIEGVVNAVSLDDDNEKIEHQASVHVEFTGVAKIVKITGQGRTDEFKDAYTKQYPDAPAWGPGKVRVKRHFLPEFDFKEVTEGFILLPGDVIDIDGGVEVEIVWITGDRAIARVPDKVKFGDTEVRPAHSRLVMSTSSYDSGFETTWDKAQHAVLGFSVGEGLDLLASTHPLAFAAVKGGKLTVSIYDAIKEADFTGQNLIAKIRIRSVIRINTLGEETIIQTIEGSPEVLTFHGEETTVEAGEMVTLDSDGILSEKESFDTAEALGDWSDMAEEWAAATGQESQQDADPANEKQEDQDDDEGGTDFGVLPLFGILAVIVVLVGVISTFVRKRRSAK